MRIFGIQIGICFALILVLSTSTYARSDVTGMVVRVADGDTITILTPENKQVKIRLYGIDSPERKQAYGHRARQYTASRIAGKIVRVEIFDIDRYGRSVGVVHTDDGGNLNHELIENGFAWHYTKYCNASFCAGWKQDELKARQSKSGLWKDMSPIEPWIFRKRSR